MRRSVPDGTHVEICGLGSFVTGEEVYSADIEDLVAEVRDLVERLNGRPTTVERCRTAYASYLEKPSKDARAHR
jgi:hypothetical protein